MMSCSDAWGTLIALFNSSCVVQKPSTLGLLFEKATCGVLSSIELGDGVLRSAWRAAHLSVCVSCHEDSNLVDPASSHTLVSKIKPCMSKYKQLYSETANGSLYQL